MGKKEDDAWASEVVVTGRRKRCGICSRPKVKKRMKELIDALKRNNVKTSVAAVGRKIVEDVHSYRVKAKTFQMHYTYHRKNCHAKE